MTTQVISKRSAKVLTPQNGFLLAERHISRHHLDTDECSDQVENHNCGNYTQCINTPGSFECQCLLGLFQKQPDFETSKSCTPIDICGAERHLQKPQCHQEAICEDLIGNYTCRCKFGFKGNGSSCIGETKIESNREKMSLSKHY